ncbi:MAG TPA: phytanoyl-CoA dioxygenase family protein [Acidimicrobiales bacterium]|nr:phytanoyl-CoA dioxygenase family protein [Acidimicrobiales bacterium]
MTPTGAELRERLDAPGYVVVDDVLDEAEIIAPLLACLLRRVEELAGRSLRRDRPDHEVLSEALEELTASGRPWSAQALDLSLPQGGVKAETPMLLEPEVFALLAAPRLLDVVASVIGLPVWLSPVGHVRVKTPEAAGARQDGLTGRVPWHQDNGVLLPEADETEILTVWIPLVAVTRTSGALQVHPSPRGTALAGHCPSQGGPSIPGSQLPEGEPVVMEMRPGSVLFMHSRTIHSSLPNLVPHHVRVSYDLRYQAVPEPTGRPQYPSWLLRDASGAAVATYEDWRDGWLEARDRAAGQEQGSFNRWRADSTLCA